MATPSLPALLPMSRQLQRAVEGFDPVTAPSKKQWLLSKETAAPGASLRVPKEEVKLSKKTLREG